MTMILVFQVDALRSLGAETRKRAKHEFNNLVGAIFSHNYLQDISRAKSIDFLNQRSARREIEQFNYGDDE